MKNIFKTLIAISVAAAVSTACIKETFPTSSSATSEQVAASPAALKASVDGMVAQTYQPYFFFGISNQLEFDISYAGLLITYSRMTCDLVNNSATIGYDWWTGYTGSYGYSMRSNTTRQTVPFMSLYKMIKSANDIIGPLGVINENELSADQRIYLGTAYVYRALMYHDLYNMYLPAANKYTDISSVDGLTVPIIVSSADEAPVSKSARAPKEELAAFIFADLDKAERLLDGYFPSSAIYPSIAVVYGLKARMSMAVLDYANAAKFARQAIDAAAGMSPLTESQWTDPTAAFCDYLGNTNSWMWYYTIAANNMGNLCNPTGFLAGESDWGYNSLTKFSLNRWMYDRINRTDFRKKSFIDPDRNTYPADYYRWAPDYLTSYPFASLIDYQCFKIRCKTGDWRTHSIGGAVDFPIMRIEEMYLIEAEAVGMSQGEAAGVKLLEDFMINYRDPGYSYALAKAGFADGFVKNFQEEVLFQKRIEFLGEGVGFFDAKRIRPGIKTWYPGANVIHNTVKYDIEEVSPYWNFVIPDDELENNEYIVKEDDPVTEIDGVKVTRNNPDPTNKVQNETTTF